MFPASRAYCHCSNSTSIARCLRAETAWLVMAERAERTERLRAAHEVAKAHEAAKAAAAALED